MKRFIIKTTIFLSIPVILCITVTFVYKYKTSNLKIDESTDILILGDSHTQSGLDDSIIKNSINISEPGHFLYSYNVLKLLLNNNSQIRKVILGASFHSFSTSKDKYIHDKSYTMQMFPKYLPVLELESIKDISGFSVKQGKSIVLNMVKSLIYIPTIHDYPFIGSFYKSNRSNLTDSIVNEAIKRHYYSISGELQEFSEYQLKYFVKIIELCRKNNIEIIVLNTPVHNNYFKRIPEKFISYYYLLIKQFDSKITFYDFHSVEFPQDFYGDADHLNIYGAESFSKLIFNKLKRQTLEFSF